MRTRTAFNVLAGCLVLGLAIGLFVRDRVPGSGGLTGLELKESLKSSPPIPDDARFRLRDGTWVASGHVDADGYVLPLDVIRPSSPSERPARGPDVAARPAGGPFPEVRLGPDDGHTQNETSIDARGSVLVAGWNNFVDDGLALGWASSADGGVTWTDGLFDDADVFSDPAVKSGGGSRWYYAYLGTPGPGGSDIDIYVRRSDDDGQSWGSPVTASLDSSFDDKPYLDAAGDEVVVAFADFGFSPARVSATVSTNGAASFSNQTVLVVNSSGGNGACPVIAPNGDYHVFWRGSMQTFLWVATSTDDGVTWTDDRTVAPMDPLPSTQPGGYRMVNLPSADANPVTGTLIVVWNDEAFGDADILCTRSTDGGFTWSAPIRVNDDSSGETQFFPWVDVDDAGTVQVMWYDRRENGFDIDVYMATSTDDGVSFGPNVRVTGSAFTPILPHEPGAADFIGDYNGIAATISHVYPFYQNSRNGDQDVFVARVPTSTVSTPDTRPLDLGFTASPTPFRSSTTLRLDDASVEAIHVVGPDGRRIRSIEVSGGIARWDGRDSAGREVAPGVYHAIAGTSRLKLVKTD